MTTKEEKAAAAKKAKAEVAKEGKSETNQPPSVAVGVFDGGGKLIRVYSLADHGEDYRSLAEQFVASPKRTGFTTKPTQIELVKKPEPKETEFVKVIHPSGDVVRVYSLSQHGKEYRELADQFVAKYAVRKYKLSDK